MGLLLLFIVSLPMYYELLKTSCIEHKLSECPAPAPGHSALKELGISELFFASFYTAIDIIFAFIFVAVAAVLFFTRSKEAMGLFSSLMLAIFGITFTDSMVSLYSQYAILKPFIDLATFIGLAAFILFFFLFPMGRFRPAWTIVIPPLLVGVPLLFNMVFGRNELFLAIWLLTCVATLVTFQTYRYRTVFNTVERHQTKWVVFGCTVALFGFLLFTVGPLLFSPDYHEVGSPLRHFMTNIGIRGSLLVIPVTLGIAVFRYRLWDINIIINQTMLYGSLTIAVFSIYILLLGLWNDQV
ncbi:hypothetical protein Q75_14680 [Bacillus coahuilensis p1.1.43]|uniref:Uncharacterized protein n=1 Tax=Bacillus coahuilensis p1.1.43 TaxID=1150625 RepID=A0A147K536_9BACI|nr:hypothetical protein Q75_14680 [Bacillus coahuilensis p1.1.43]